MNTKDGLVQLDELVVMHEMFLQSLTKRKALVAKQRQGMATKLQEHVDTLEELQNKEAGLDQGMRQHIQLQQELTIKLSKSEAILGRNACVELEAELEMKEEINNQDSIKKDTGEAEVESQGSVKTQEDVVVDLKGDDEVVMASAESPFKKRKHPESSFMSSKIDQKALLAPKWLKAKTTSSFLSLHWLVDGPRLERIMELQLQEDRTDPNATRESIYHTCLLPYQWKEYHSTSRGLVQEELSSLDPNTSLCPYELAGTCADPYCTFQHMKTRDTLQVLAKELMPLPELRLPKALESDDGSLAKRRKVELTETIELEEGELEDDEEESEKDSVVSPSDTKALDFNEDFLSLPVSNTDDASESSDDHQGPRMWWMSPEDEERFGEQWPPAEIVSMGSYLRIIFNVEAVGDNELFCHAYSDASFLLEGRLIDALQFVLHSGRHDLGQAILTMISESLRRHPKELHLGPLETWCEKFGQWTPSGHERNLFVMALEQQVSLACISHFLRLLHEHKVKDTNPFQQVLKRILKVFTNQHPLSRMQTLLENLATNGSDAAKGLTGLVNVCAEIEGWYASKNPLEAHDETKDLIDKLDDIRKSAHECRDDPLRTLWTITHAGFFANAVIERLGRDGATSQLAFRLDSKLDNVCCWMVETYGPDLQTLVAPVLALRVSLMVALKRYDRSQRAIELHLGNTSSVFAFSDLLWSQLATLKSHLPSRQSRGNRQSLPRELSSRVQSLGVKLNYLTLPGDRNLFQPFIGAKPCTDRNAKKWRKSVRPAVTVFASRLSREQDGLLFDLDLSAMSLGGVERYPGKLVSLSALLFPRSLLYGGSYLRKLDMTCCLIESLPHNFGAYFPNLKVRAMCGFQKSVGCYC